MRHGQRWRWPSISGVVTRHWTWMTFRGTWDHVTGLLLHAGQPFADTSLFAVNAICRLMRQHVTVALSGDGGDEGFGGYNFYWRLARIARWQRLPVPVWRGASAALARLARSRGCSRAPATAA